MLSKKRRISRSLFKEVSKRKKFSHTPHFLLMFQPFDKTSRFGVSVSKKVSKSAVIRNRIRRRVYSGLGKMISKIKPGIFVVSAKPGSEQLKGEKLINELEKLFINHR